jgi:hypothetical protein
MPAYNRGVARFDADGLLLGPPSREQPQGQLLVITPVGGMQPQRRDTTPMNLVEVEESGGELALRWALPVSSARLELEPTDPGDEELFALAWGLIDECVGAGAGMECVVWETTGPVGRQGVELRKARPWLDLAQLPDGPHLLVPCSTSHTTRPRSRLHASIDVFDLEVTGGQLLRYRSMVAELAHFAAVDPVSEGLLSAGLVRGTSAATVREEFLGFPQRDSSTGEVLI